MREILRILEDDGRELDEKVTRQNGVEEGRENGNRQRQTDSKRT